MREDRLREVFNIFDVDKSGAITVDEIKKILGGFNGGGATMNHSIKLGETINSMNSKPNILAANQDS